MEKNELDDLFREKVEQNRSLPENIKWNPDFGWDEYQKTFGAVKISIVKILIFLSSAAAILILFFMLFKINQSSTDLICISNNSKQPKDVILPCGNSVWLNKQSSVAFSKNTNSTEYHIDLSGEAFIEIKNPKSKIYVITSNNAVIRSEAPASFNIRAYPNEGSIDVTVNSGAVKVSERSYQEGLALLISEGNYCSLEKQYKVVFASTNNNANYMAWKTGKFIFANTPIETVTEVLAKYYGKEIEVKGNSIAYCSFSGTFSVENIDLILNQIRTDLKLDITNAGKKITLSGIGCL